ncbi:hypothetical protein PR202_gb12829 [Eleusine coracana subsp. coracana]|uniref:Uncharacterized protein n=1 Tax=Eleusine coracana subsp. coracana TaxID=191504 RepID=A0AAV5ES20_ELECO|nr:hypothetical protein PR202_gb12829 [Eleusine coracana subsp. coracana]
MFMIEKVSGLTFNKDVKNLSLKPQIPSNWTPDTTSGQYFGAAKPPSSAPSPQPPRAAARGTGSSRAPLPPRGKRSGIMKMFKSLLGMCRNINRRMDVIEKNQLALFDHFGIDPPPPPSPLAAPPPPTYADPSDTFTTEEMDYFGYYPPPPQFSTGATSSGQHVPFDDDEEGNKEEEDPAAYALQEGQEHRDNSWRRAAAGAVVPSAGTGLGGTGLGGVGLGNAGLGGPILGGTGRGSTGRGCSGLETGGLGGTGRGSAGLGSAGLGSLGLFGPVLGGTVRGCTGRGSGSLETGGLGYDGLGSSDMADLGVDASPFLMLLVSVQTHLMVTATILSSVLVRICGTTTGATIVSSVCVGVVTAEVCQSLVAPLVVACHGTWPQLCLEAVAACHRLLVEVVGANVHVHLMVDMILVAVVRQRWRTSHHVQMYLSLMAMSILRLPVKMKSFRKPQISTRYDRLGWNEVLGTVDATDEYWQRITKVRSHCKQLKYGPPEHEELLAKIFGGVVVDGSTSCAPGEVVGQGHDEGFVGRGGDEDGVIEKLLDMTVDCGVSEDSAEYFMATLLFKDARNRSTFKAIKTKNGRVAWLRRHCDKEGLAWK